MKRNDNEGDSKPEMHTYIHIEGVSHEKMVQYLTHALATGDTISDLAVIGPATLTDYYKLDEISHPFAEALRDGSAMPSSSDVTGMMIDEIIRLTPLTDEASQKRLKVLREGIGNAQYAYRILGHAIKQAVQLANTESIVTAAKEMGPEFNLKDKIMEAAMLMGPHLKNCVVESAQTMGATPINMSMITFMLYREELVTRMADLMKKDGGPEYRAFLYLNLFATAMLNKANQHFNEVYKIDADKTKFTEEMKNMADTYVTATLEACKEAGK